VSDRLLRPTTKKSGRPISEQTIAIREEILELPFEQEQMTVRGIFYALTTRGIVEKSEAGYRQVQRQVLLLRRESELDWGFVADGTRWVNEPETWDAIEDALTQTARTYRRNLWRSQGIRLEIWLEKDALASLISTVTHKWGVRLMVSRGQSSETYCYHAAREAQIAWDEAGVETFVYALYDSDRYGRDAAAKVEEKLRRYSNDTPIGFELLAVTDWQIEMWNLPTRPAKREGDPDAVELDAIPPDKLKSLVDNVIIEHIDTAVWEKEQAVEANERAIGEQMVGRVA
jgi:hypothetical protein